MKERLPLLRDLLAVGLILLVAYKLFQADWTIEPSAFPTQEVLSVVLALFAIGLSILFYLKATEVSNRFHNDIYHFTKDVSEILGRIESGFGEQLRHLDQGYSSLRDYVGRIPAGDKELNQEVQETKAEIKEEEATVKKIESERKRLIEELVQRTSLHEEEKNAFIERLDEKERELMGAQGEVRKLRRQMALLKRSAASSGSLSPEPSMRLYARHRVAPLLEENLGERLGHVPRSMLLREFKKVAPSLNPRFIEDMRNAGYVDGGNSLTPEGFKFILSLPPKPPPSVLSS